MGKSVKEICRDLRLASVTCEIPPLILGIASAIEQADEEKTKELEHIKKELARATSGKPKPQIHELKINSVFADDVYTGAKSFEVRLNDRNYKVGDIIKFTVIKSDKKVDHQLNGLEFEITYILDGKSFGIGLKDDYVVLGIRRY
jgi:hypothetical protein|nr:MAG TPA: activating signal cointegrator [Caudoviricetes sp.]